MKDKIISFFKYSLFFAFGLWLLGYLVMQIGDGEIKNSPFHKTHLELIEKKLIDQPILRKESINLKDNFSNLSDSEIEEGKNGLLKYFDRTERLKLGLFKIGNDLASARYGWIIISLIVALISHWYRALRWNLLINTLGYKPRTVITFLSILIGYLANVVVPRLGEVTKCAVLSKSEKIPTDKLLGTVLLERGIDLLSLLFIILVAFLLQLDVLSGFFEEIFSKREGEETFTLIFFMKIVGIISLIVLAFWIILRLGIKLFSMTPWYFKLKRLYIGFMSGLKTISKLKRIRLFIFHSCMIWFGYFLMVYLCFPAYEPLAHLIKSPLVGLSTLAIGSLGMVAPVQGGIGAYHFCIQLCLQLYGYAKEVGLSFAFIVHTAQTLLIIVSGLISLLLIPFISKRLKTNEQD